MMPDDVADWIAPDPIPRSDVKHIEMQGHPSQNYRRSRMAECGHYFAVFQFAPNVDAVTCPGCMRVLNAREAVEM